jgi:hypothetical protein
MLSSFRYVKAPVKETRKFNKLYGSSIIAGRSKYKIVWALDIQVNDDTALGLCDSHEKKIYININSEEIETTLIHEVMHAEFSEAGMRQMPSWNLDIEELCCEAASRMCLNFIVRKARGARI